MHLPSVETLTGLLGPALRELLVEPLRNFLNPGPTGGEDLSPSEEEADEAVSSPEKMFAKTAVSRGPFIGAGSRITRI